MFNYTLQPFKAYCAIWVRRSNFRHQASPRMSPCESTHQRKVELWVRNVREFCLNADLPITFRDLLHAVNLRHGPDGFTFPPKEGLLGIFFALKIRRLWPGANPQTWVPKANTLPLDHQNCFWRLIVLSEVRELLSQWHDDTSRKYCIFCDAGVRGADLTDILLSAFSISRPCMWFADDRTDVLLCNYNVCWNKSDASTSIHSQQTLRKKHF
jgi:hypothetical protein